jgi:cell division protein FtsB
VIAWVTTRLAIGSPDEGSIDPSTFSLTLTSQQWFGLAAGLIAVGVVVAIEMAVAVHAAAGPGGKLRDAVRKIRANSLQIFWLQYVIYALAFRFSPWAALLLWLVAGFAVPIAVCENLGPASAVDRAWDLSQGARGRIVALELLLPLLPLSLWVILGYLSGSGNQVQALNPSIRMGILALVLALVLLAIQFLFVCLSYLYQAIANKRFLHVPAASSVSP